MLRFVEKAASFLKEIPNRLQPQYTNVFVNKDANLLSKLHQSDPMESQLITSGWKSGSVQVDTLRKLLAQIRNKVCLIFYVFNFKNLKLHSD